MSTSDDDSSFPWWAWFHAVQDIVKKPTTNGSTSSPLPVAILPWLYLSPIYCVRDNIPRLQELGITHVLTTNRMAPRVLETMYWELKSVGIDQHYLAADDTLDYNLLDQHWEECRNFIQEDVLGGGGGFQDNHNNDEDDDDKEDNKDEEEKENGNNNNTNNNNHHQNKVVVHCNAGLNRSGTIVAAAMIYFGEMELLPVVQQLKTQRGKGVLSNESFVKQLIQFAARQGRLGIKPQGYSNDPPPPPPLPVDI